MNSQVMRNDGETPSRRTRGAIVVSSSVEHTYSRPITADEWWRFATPQGLVTEVQLCVEGDGDIDAAALTAAVAAASQACPGSRLMRRKYRWIDSGRPPQVSVTGAADFDRVRLDSPLLRTPLACQGRTSCEVVLVQGAPTTVIFRAHPATMDGRGVMLWQRQVFRALRGEAVEDADSPLNYDDVNQGIAARLGIGLPPVDAPSGPPWRSVLGQLPKGPRRSIWRRRTIDGIHMSMTAKVARLVSAHGDGDGDGMIGIPVDLRQYMPDLRTTASVTGHVNIHVERDDDWTDVDAKLLTALSEHQFLSNRSDPMVLSMPIPLLRELRRWMDNLGKLDQETVREKKLSEVLAGVSHLGAVDLADFCADGFEATSYYALGAVTFAPEIDIAESRGRTEITVAWRDGPGAAGRVEALLDQIEEELSPRSHRVWELNRTDRPAPPATLTSLFAEQVRRTPDAVAISSAEGDLSYAELDARAAAIAAALRARGAGRDDRIGLVAGRSPAAIAAIWGILKAGAAYLQIDAGYPDARIAQLLSDAGVTVCLLEPPDDQRDCLPAGCQGIDLDALPRTPPAPWRDADVRPEDLANIIYTSGSTGAPKGVEIEHRSLVNYVRWASREAGIDGSARMPLIASMSFDMAGCAIFLPLLAGGTVLPVREVNAVTLREVIEDGGATAMAITPSHLDLFNQAGIGRSVMRVVMTAGELLRRSTALRAREVFGPQCKILCQWGPTETTIVNTSHEFDPEADTEAGVPFGRPMDNNTVHLLDSQGRFVAPGEPGEAYVGGIQVARGYLGRPDLTRQRFVRLADGTRVYRTGDIARRLPSGELTFISRIDDQVKIAGHRIEPAEIAQALEDHPAVRQAAVIPRSRPGRQDKELCAYVTGSPAPAPAALKQFLAARLPRYMIPAAIIAVPQIPRTANGKTDTRQLPDPFSGTPRDDTPVPGRDEVTSAVARIWARALHVDAHLIDDHTDFRELGGNSILMLSMLDEVCRTFAGDARAEFMTELGQIIREPTLRTVSDVARQTRAWSPAEDKM
jgi:amino acid adenylation domain-containing protein